MPKAITATAYSRLLLSVVFCLLAVALHAARPLMTPRRELLVMHNGDYVNLVPNPEAKNPSFAEMAAFIRRDNTNTLLYVNDKFMCTEFAVRLYAASQTAGIRCGFVGLDFSSGPGHALVAYETTDRGMIYVDCTGGVERRNSSSLYDTVAYIKVGQPYGRLDLATAERGGTDYSFYETTLIIRAQLKRESDWLAREKLALDGSVRDLKEMRLHLNRFSKPSVDAYNVAVAKLNERQVVYNHRCQRANEMVAQAGGAYEENPETVEHVNTWWR